MFIPSGTGIPEAGFQVTDSSQGLYRVENAYEGEYQYFDGRTLSNGQDEEHSSDSTSADNDGSPVTAHEPAAKID